MATTVLVAAPQEGQQGLTEAVATNPDFTVLAALDSGKAVLNQVARLRPDIVVFDLDLADLDGLSCIERLRSNHQNTAAVLLAPMLNVDAEEVVQAAAMGANATITKDDWQAVRRAASIIKRLQDARPAAKSTGPLIFPSMVSKQELDIGGRAPLPASLQQAAPGLPAKTHLITIGSSTGGVQALNRLFAGLKPPMPPIMIVQHIQQAFAKKFAERLNRDCDLTVKLATHGEKIVNNTVYIAPADYHLELRCMPVAPVCYVQENTPVMNHLPSVEVMMMSVAGAEFAEGAVSIMLTGMGNDGSSGMLAMRHAGAYTIGESEASCVVYGMPRAAKQCGGVEVELSLDQIRQCLEYVRPVG